MKRGAVNGKRTTHRKMAQEARARHAREKHWGKKNAHQFFFPKKHTKALNKTV